MIKPLAPSDISQPNFVVLDIENWLDGSVLTIDICWRENGVIQHELFYNWNDFWKWIVKKARNDTRFRCVYAHNGGGWDWLSLASYLLREGKRERQYITGSIACSKLITMTVKLESQFTIHFCDSLQLLRSPLAKLAEKFDTEKKKIDLGGLLPHEIWEQNKTVFYAYVRNDTESLLMVLERALEIIREKVAKIDNFGYTIGSTALKVFKTMGLPHEISTPWEIRVREYLRKGYRGGRVEVFKPGIYENVTVYDVNSLYPFAMLTTDVPISDRGAWVSEFDPQLSGCYEIEFNQRNRDVPAVLMIDGIGAYEGTGHYYTPEINSLLKYGNPELKIKSGYVFLDNAKLFQDYVNKLYAVRMEDIGGPLDLLAKFLLNSLYGKFAQNPLRKNIVAIESIDELYWRVAKAQENNGAITEISSELGVYFESEEKDVSFEHVGIAGMITSKARAILYDGIISAGANNVLYCDTDSVHTTGALHDKIVGTKIGQFKIEFKGDGAYIGKKLYALRKPGSFKSDSEYGPPNPVTKIRAKGVTVGGNNGANISWSDFVRMAKGEKIACEFKQPATAKQVFSGAAPCCFQNRKRTIGIYKGTKTGTGSRRNRAAESKRKVGIKTDSRLTATIGG